MRRNTPQALGFAAAALPDIVPALQRMQSALQVLPDGPDGLRASAPGLAGRTKIPCIAVRVPAFSPCAGQAHTGRTLPFEFRPLRFECHSAP